MKKNKYKTWCIRFLGASAAALLAVCLFVVVIDPYFHYHKPLEGLSYRLQNERYQNDGILKYFKYDAVITGSSMTENFKTSEFDELFGTNSVKTSFQGASFWEIYQRLTTAFESGNEVRYVLWCLDTDYLTQDKDLLRTDMGEYPDYLYDDNLLNDVQYVLNKDVVIRSMEVVKRTISGEEPTSFDEYANWNSYFSFGKDVLLSSYTRAEATEETVALTEEERETIIGNIRQNVAALAEAHPDTEFLLYLSPYSICWWDSIVREGKLDWEIEVQQIVIEELLNRENVRLYSFFDDYDVICDLDNYKDTLHYGEWINSRILEDMKAGEHLLTEENYEVYLEEIREFYAAYDYEEIYR